MNHLAHFLLAQGKPHLEVGAFLGDYVKGSLQGQYPRNIENGIRLHRRIDAFTAKHPVIRQSCSRIDPHLRRYAPIMIDVFFDHFLARQWSTYGNGPLHKFSDRIFTTLESAEDIMPRRARAVARRMNQHQVLSAYADANFLIPVLYQLSQRLKRDNPLAKGFTQFENNQLELEQDFASFFPDVVAYARDVACNLDPGD
ncbi:MAG: ACP phosphodiesterase [Gammaproteobacteria bacterium]|nr:ACP phosphodiesterase [Gammaproteobacteria bacterium]